MLSYWKYLVKFLLSFWAPLKLLPRNLWFWWKHYYYKDTIPKLRLLSMIMSLTAVAIKMWEHGRWNREGQGGQGSLRLKPGQLSVPVLEAKLFFLKGTIHREWCIKFATHTSPIYTPFKPFFGKCINIFQKTEAQSVILRCWMDLYLNWLRSYVIKR